MVYVAVWYVSIRYEGEGRTAVLPSPQHFPTENAENLKGELHPAGEQYKHGLIQGERLSNTTNFSYLMEEMRIK